MTNIFFLKKRINLFQASPSNFTTVGSESTHLGVIEDFVASEEIFLNGFFNVLSQVRNVILVQCLRVGPGAYPRVEHLEVVSLGSTLALWL